MRSKILVVTLLTLALLFSVSSLQAKAWKKKGDAFEIVATASSAGVAERMSLVIGSSICTALGNKYYEEVERKERPIKSHINGTLVTSWEIVMTMKFHDKPEGKAGPCDAMSDAKKAKKYAKQLKK